MGGTKQVLGVSTNGQSKDLLESGPGNPCAVFLNDEVDFFGAKPGIWCIGYLMKQNAKKAKVRLLDYSEEERAAESMQIQMLAKNLDDDDDDVNKAPPKETRYDCDALCVVENPNELKVGDLVYGRFQKGLLLEDVPPDVRVLYRGRVAGVGPIENSCNICYDDGDYEMSVPYAEVVRVMVHRNETDWMNGIQIASHAKSRTTGVVATEAVVSISDQRQVRFHYTVGDEKWSAKVAYKNALLAIFQHAKEKIDPKRRLPWPSNDVFTSSLSTPKRPPPPPEEKHNEKRSEQHSKKAKKSSTSGKAKTSRSQRKTSNVEPMDFDGDTAKSDKKKNDECVTPAVRRPTKRLVVYAEDSEDDVKEDEDDDEAAMDAQDGDYSGAKGKKMKPSYAAGTVTRRSQRSTARKTTTTNRFRSDVPAVPETTPPAMERMEPLPECALALVPMSRMEASTLEKFWGHEPFAGHEMLMMNLTGRGRKPSKDLWVELIRLVTFGPKHEEVYFPDSYRMELTTDYILTLFRINGTLQDCCDVLSDEYSKDDGFGDVVLTQMMQDYYMALDDLDRDTSANRIGTTVHAKCCSSCVFLEILRFRIHQSVVDDQEPALLHDLFRQAPKECLRKAILVAKSIWKVASRSTGTVEFHRLAESWGCILSYMAWWYGKTAREDANALADLLSDIQVAVEEESVLLDVIDTLRPEIIPQVRPNLAERWSLVEVYNLCYK